MHTPSALKFLLITCLAMIQATAATAEPPIAYDAPENVRKFADFLYEQGDYRRAAGEYQRYLFYAPEDRSDSDPINYKIALCYRFAGQTEQAIQSFQQLAESTPEGQFANLAYYQIGATYFLAERFEHAARSLRETLPHITDAHHHAEAQQLIGLSSLMLKEWSEAEAIFKGLQRSAPAAVREKAGIYHGYATRGMHLPTRSPFLAGALSTLLPGAGRLYTGEVGDALTSLIIVGLMGWQAYDGFQRDGRASVKGWTLGTLGGIFYVGNIYGSVISARMYNRWIEDDFLAGISIELPY